MKILRKIKAFFCIYLILLSSIAQAENPNTLPTNPNITNGSAVINQSGSSLTIHQSTEKLITNWSTFNIGRNASVEFIQPNSSSSALNRVNSNDPTHIYGSLKANGKVILMNPSGVLFHNGSRVDVGALIATSLNMQDGNFLNNQYIFEKDGIAGTVNNKGIINAFENGAVALIAPDVKNEGSINTPSGTTALLSGDKVTLTLNGNKLIQYSINTGTLNSLVENKHAINAGDGIIILSAKGLENISQSVVKNSGTLKAEGITNKGGKIFLTAREGEVINTGTVSVNSQNNQGGDIEITADDIKIKSGSTLSAKGRTGGGKILVGGSWQNSDTNVYQATTTTVESGSLIDASATDNGDGGEVVIWSDIYDSNSITKAQGTINANAGPNGGDGGRIETSGYKLITDGVSGSASSNFGVAGLWLFDPTNIEIGSSGSSADGTDDGSNLTASSINSLLNAGTSVTVTTQSSSSELGDLTVSSEINKSSGASDVTLTLRAANLIRINDEIKHTGGTGVLNIILDSDNNTSSSTAGSSPSRDGGGIIIMEDNISSGGGDITFGGTTSGGFTGGDLYIGGSSTALSINSGGGDIDIKGQVLISNTSSSGVTISSSNGSVTVGGSIDSANTYRFVDDSEITATSSSTEWLNASADAVLKGGYLVSITSRIENQLAAAATISGGSYRGAWIGAWRDKDNTKSGGATYWYYDDNSPEANTAFLNQGTGPINSAYNNFGTGEPNGTGTGGEWAGQFFGDQANWNDLVGTRDYSQDMGSVYNVMGYVMETNVNPTKLTINAGTGDVTLSGAVGSNKVLSDFTITGAQVTGSSVALNNSTDLNITNSGTSSLTGVISGTSVDLIKNGSGVLTLSGNNTYTGSTTVSNGTLAISSNNALGTNAAGTTVASGATLDIQNTTYSTTEAITLNGGTIATSTGTSTFAGTITLGADSIIDIDGTKLTLSGVISDGVNNFAIDKTGTGNLVLSGTNTFSGDTTVSAGTLTLTGALSSSTDLIVNSSSTFDLQTSQTVASLDLDGTISKTTGSSSLTVSGASDIGGNITTSGIQTYTGAVTLSANSTLTTTNSQITFSNTLNSDSTTRNLTASVGTSEVQFDGIVGGTNSLGAIAITGALDLNAAISSASSLSVSTTSNLGANVTTSGTQTYTGEVDLSSDITFTTSNSNVTFSDNIILSSASQSLTISAGTGNVSFGGSVGGLFVEDEAGTIGTQTVLTSANWASTVDTVGTFSHSVNFGGSAVTIGDINFVAATNTANPLTVNSDVTVVAVNTLSDNWDVENLGSDSDSTNLNTLLGSIKWSNDGVDNDADDVKVQLSNLTAGKVYKLQMFFGEDSNSSRGFDIDFENGSNVRAEIRADYDTNPDSNSLANPAKATFIDYTFQAEGTTANLILDGDGWNGDGGATTDKNPIISGVSLEEISEISSNALSSLTVTSGSFSNSGNIYSDGAISVTSSDGISLNSDIKSSTASNISFYAANNINTDTTGLTIESAGGDILFNSNTDGNGGAINLDRATVKSNGGDISLVGGSDGSGFAQGINTDEISGLPTQTKLKGIFLNGTYLDARGSSSGGNLLLRGRGWQGATNTTNYLYPIGIDIVSYNNDSNTRGSKIITNNSGTINLNGIGGNQNNNTAHNVGINFFSNSGTANIISSGSGNIDISATAGNTTLSSLRAALNLDGGTASIYSNSGDITLEGIAGSSSDTGIRSAATMNIGWDGTNSGTSGDITLTTDSISSSSFSFRGSGTLTVQPYDDDFDSNLSWSNITTSSDITGLTIGKASSADGTSDVDVTIGSSASVTGPVTIYADDITLNAALTAASGSSILTGKLAGASNFTQTAGSLEVNATGDSSYSGVMSGSGSFTKSGSGALTLSGTNSYTGSTSINAGTLKITDAAGLGTTASGTTVASGATLEVSGGLTIAETLSLSGTGASSNGALRFTSGNNTYSGNITLGAHSSVNATAGNNIISGTVNGAYNFVVVSTAGSFTQSGIAGGTTALTTYDVNSSTYNTTISAAVTTNGNINIEAGSIDITANLTATSGNIVLDADTGSAINSGDDGINIGDITIRTNTSGNITLTGRSGSGNTAGLMGVQASGGSTTINSAGNLSVTGISESTNTSATRGIWLKGDYDATGNITLAGQAKSSNDYDVSVQDSTFDAGGNITFDAQNGGRINFAGTNTLTATGNHIYKGDNFVPNSATFNGSGSFSLTPDTDSTAFSTGIDISSVTFGTSLTDFTVGVSTNNADITLGSVDVDGEINVFGDDITLSNTLTAGSNENIVLSAETNFVNNRGSDALNVSGTGRWIVYAADDDNSTFGNLNSNNAPIWDQQYSSLAPASVSSGNRYVFQESSPSQNITFTTTDETITYGDSVDLSDNYSITSSGVSGLANVYAAVPSGGSVSISDAFSANPTITSAGTSAGSHNIRVASGDEGTANSGYNVTYSNSGTLTVNRKAITVTADDQSKQYGNANPSLTQTVTTGSLVGSDTLSGSITTAAATGSNVGSYSITQGTLTNANNSNYDITFVNGSLTVSRRDITLTADDKTKTYGDNNPSLTYTVSTGSLYSSDTLSGSIATSATASTGAGSVNITQGTLTNANNSNYNITFNNGSLTINKKALTVVADNKTRTYGASNPTLTYTLTSGSLVGSDSLSGALTTTATSSTNVGSANITQGTLTNANNSNYTISYTTGTLSITKASPTISGLSNQSKTTDDSSFTLAGTPSISGPTLSYTSSDTDVATVNSSTGEVSILASGTSTITASFTGNSNWNSGSGTYLLTVTEPTVSSSSSTTQVADNAAQDVTTVVRQNVRRNSNVVLPGTNTNTFARPTLISYGNVSAPSPIVSPITTTPSTSVIPSVSTPSQSSSTLVAPTPSQSSSTLVAPTPSQTSNISRGVTNNNQSASLPNASSNQTPASPSATSPGTTTLSSNNVQITSFTAQVDGSVTVRKSTVTANTNVETEGLIPSAQVVVLRPNQDAKVENSFEVKVNSSEAQLKPLSNTSQDYFKPGKLIGSTKFVVELENGLVFNYTIDVQEGGVVIKPADNQSIQFAESNKQVVIGSGILEAVNALGVSPDNMKTIFLDYKS
ncbi:MAG: autotransporter-associated beta strand repeat-containing protein [Pelagibacteraceae bacterium]|nr:autotransporter-associated beta strand repeat-containing protein [Pelagibacteraceae bacterium]MCI5079668.1 autotransporter-associated beta strand repeat-containing protein [Pelagibacteraceae bacterium]